MSDPTLLRTLAAEDARALLVGRKQPRAPLRRQSCRAPLPTGPARPRRRAGRDCVRSAAAAAEVAWRGAWIWTAAPQETLTESSNVTRSTPAASTPRSFGAAERAATRAARDGPAHDQQRTRASELRRARLTELAAAESARSAKQPARTADRTIGSAAREEAGAMTRHFLHSRAWRRSETEHYLLARRAVLDALERCAMAVIDGNAGSGEDLRRRRARGTSPTFR